jgi:enoyl-[acyl-carrier protein] reductase III
MDEMSGLSGLFFITGGTRGIGRAISLRFARAGGKVIANFVRDQAAADDLRATAEREGLQIGLCRADLTTPQGLETVKESVIAAGGICSGLVHCAATGVHRPFSELTSRHFDWTFSLNVKAFLELVKSLIGRFSDQASIVAVSSMGAARTLPYYSLVGASKAALEAVSRHLSVELAPRGIRVNILAPGTVQTGVWNVLPDAEVRIAAAAQRSPIGRLVTPEEVACAAQFLCSAAASGIVGQTLVVDGGAGLCF